MTKAAFSVVSPIAVSGAWSVKSCGAHICAPQLTGKLIAPLHSRSPKMPQKIVVSDTGNAGETQQKAADGQAILTTNLVASVKLV